MQEVNTFEKIVSIITPYCRNTENLKNINKKTHFLKDLNINSARFVDIVLAIEDKFDVAIDDDSADKFQTIEDVMNFLSKKVPQV